jgi:hypothetical protein
MFLRWLIIGVLAMAWTALYIGRRNWRWRWDRLLLISVAFQAVAFLLIAPFNNDLLSRWAYQLTGLGLLPDFLGHVCQICATDALIVAVAYRLMPKPERLRGRVEGPSAIASAAMLLTFTLSQHPQPHCKDFFACPLTPWLRAYWMVFSLIAIYLITFLAYILLAIRREYPESAQIANLYLAAILVGSIVCAAGIFEGLTGKSVNPLWMWIPICTASGLSFIAGSWTWTRNKVQ